MVGPTHLGSFYTHQTQMGSAGTQQPRQRQTRCDYAAFSLSASINDSLSEVDPSQAPAWLSIKRSADSVYARLDECLEWIADSAHPTEHSNELRQLKQFRQVCNSGGYRPWDEQLISFWHMKRSKRSLMDLRVWVELSGQVRALQVSDLYRLANLCFLPYLLFYDLTHAHRYRSAHPNEPNAYRVQGVLDRVFLKKVSNEVGWGLFARENLPVGASIGDYTGVVRLGEQGGSYCMEYDNLEGESLVVDAQYLGNHTRFMNHSAQAPNLEALGMRDTQQGIRIVCVTKEPVKQGQQLLIDYGERYWVYRNAQALGS